MRIAVRIVLAGLGLLAVTAKCAGKRRYAQTTPQARQTGQNANEINAVPNGHVGFNGRMSSSEY